MVFCDGAVHAISYSIDGYWFDPSGQAHPGTHALLGNRHDGLVIDPNKF